MGKINSTNPNTEKSVTHKVLKAMGGLGSAEGINMACSVVRTKLVALVTGTAGVGVLGLLGTSLEMLTVLAQMGLRTAGVKEIAATEGEGRAEKTTLIYKASGWLAIIGGLMTVILSPGLSWVTFGNIYKWPWFVVVGMCVCFNVMTCAPMAFLQGNSMLRRLGILSVISAVLSLAISIPMIYVMGMRCLVWILLVYSLITMMCYFIGTRSVWIKREVRPESRNVWTGARSLLSLGAFVTVSSSATWLAGYIVMSVLNRWGGEGLMGLYQAGNTMVIKYPGVVFSALALEYFPRLTSAISNSLRRAQVMMRHESMLSVSVIAILASALVVFAPVAVKLLYSGEFLPVVVMIFFAAPGLVFRASSWSIAYTILARGRGKVFLMTELLSASISVLTALSGYAICGLAGIGVGFTVWYGMYMVIVDVAAKKYVGVTLGKGAVLYSVSAACGVALVVLAGIYLSVWVSAGIALTVAVLSGLMIKKIW